MTVQNETGQDFLSRKTAHDLKNIFATLIANAELLSEGGNEQEKKMRIDRILKVCANGVSLVEEIQENNSATSAVDPAARSITIPGAGHVLLVEDESAMLELELRILLSQGYKVTSCLSAREAFAIFLEDPHAIDLILTDQEMPDRTGTQLIKEIHGVCPGLPCILITGDAGYRPEDEEFMECCTLLIKPVNRAILLAAVRDSLAG